MYFDLVHLRIPNALSVVLLVLFFSHLLLYGVNEPILFHFLAMLMTLALLFPLFAVNIFGGGDVKFLTVLALWCGWQNLLPLLVLVGLIGGLVTAVILMARIIVNSRKQAATLPASLVPGAPIPYGIPIGASAWLLHAVELASSAA
jgi:prepilin peptidase CpaA